MSDFAKKHGVGLVVTLGESGAALIDRSGKYFKIESEKVSVVDTTGAGDCFVGTFAAGLNEGLRPEIAAKLELYAQQQVLLEKAHKSLTQIKLQLQNT